MTTVANAAPARPANVVAAGSDGLDDVIAFGQWVRAGIASRQQPAGCLIVNTMVELGASDPELALVARSHRDQLRASLRAALARAERAGEIERRTAGARALVVEVSVFGALATGQAGAGDEADPMVRGSPLRSAGGDGSSVDPVDQPLSLRARLTATTRSSIEGRSSGESGRKAAARRPLASMTKSPPSWRVSSTGRRSRRPRARSWP